MKAKWQIVVPITLLALAGVGAAAAYKISGLADSGRELEAQLARARTVGMSTSIADLARLASVPEGQNAASEYRKAFASLTQRPSPAVRVLSNALAAEPYGLTAREESEALKSFRDAQAEFERVERATKLAGVDFERKWEQAPGLDMPELVALKTAAKYLQLRSRIGSQSSEPLEALQDVAAISRMARQISHEPHLGAVQTSLALDAMAMEALQQVVCANPKNAKVLQSALAFAQDLSIPDLRPSISGEAAMWRQALSRMAQGQEDPWGGELGNVAYSRYDAVRLKFEAKCLKNLVDLYEALPGDPNDFVKVAEALDRCEKEREADSSWAGRSLREYLPSYGSSLAGLIRAQAARHHVLMGGIRLLLAGAPFPTTLPFEVIDAANGKPASYRSQGGSFVLYSVGTDLDDDGGSTPAEDEKVRGGDIAFRFPATKVIKKRPLANTGGLMVPSTAPGSLPAPPSGPMPASPPSAAVRARQ